MLPLLLALLAATLAQGVTRAPIPYVPTPVRDFLQANPEYRLVARQDIDPIHLDATDAVPSMAIAELTGDGWADVVAVVVRKRNPEWRALVAFHGSSKGFTRRPMWAIRPTRVELLGVQVEGTRVIPLECIECDSNGFMRWSGSTYERNLWRVGEDSNVYRHNCGSACGIALSSGTGKTAATVATLPECTSVTILEVLPLSRGAERWYRVRAMLDGRAVEGYLAATALTEIGCIG